MSAAVGGRVIGVAKPATSATPGAAPNPFDQLVDFFDAVRATPSHRRLVAACYEPVLRAPAGAHLDVGCGAGELVARSVLRGRAAIGLDVSVGMCRRARRLVPDARFLVGAVERLPFADRSFVALTAMLVVHLSDAGRALREAARVLLPRGVISLVTQSTTWTEDAARAYVAERRIEGPEREFCIGSAKSGEAHRPFAAVELADLLRTAGFAEVQVHAAMDGAMWVAEGRRAT
jgi:ubiquinone/menaquinone biosynthesis C-methylase UbiE